MAIMNPSKLRDILEVLPYSGFRESKQKAIKAIITKYLNGEIVHVVRCKDCEHRGDVKECPMCFEEEITWDEDGWEECEWVVHDFATDDGFCHLGERRSK